MKYEHRSDNQLQFNAAIALLFFLRFEETHVEYFPKLQFWKVGGEQLQATNNPVIMFMVRAVFGGR